MEEQMKLSEISYVLTENVEKLIPYLRQELSRYHAFKIPSSANLPQDTAKIDGYLMALLSYDPKFYEEHIQKKKKLEHCKAPFAKDLIRMFGQSGMELNDINSLHINFNQEEIRGYLKAYNNSKRMGGNIDISKIGTIDDLAEVVEEYHVGEAIPSEAEAYGFDKLYEDSSFVIYNIDKYYDSAESLIPAIKELAETSPENAHVHACFTVTNWCVRHKGAFYSYKPSAYQLVYTKIGRRYSKTFLIHFQSGQWKDPNDGCGLGCRGGRASVKLKEAQRFAKAMILNSQQNSFAKEFSENLAVAQKDYKGVENYLDIMNLIYKEMNTIVPGFFAHPNNTNLPIEVISAALRSKMTVEDLTGIFDKYSSSLSDQDREYGYEKYGMLIIQDQDIFSKALGNRFFGTEFVKWSGFENWESMLANKVNKHEAKISATALINYAINIRKKRWPEAELAMMSNTKAYNRYEDLFKIGDTNEGTVGAAFRKAVAKMNLMGDVDDEDIMPLLEDLNFAVQFAIQYYGSGWVELEQELKKPENAELQQNYKTHFRL
jgi:hypothetical protein